MRRTKQDAAATRDAILDAAERMFFRQGVSQTTLSQIAADAGVTRGAVYWHFTGKAAVFGAMQDRAYLPQQEFLSTQRMLDEPDPMAALHRVTLESVDRFIADERARRVYAILTLRCEYVGEMEEALRCQRDAEDTMLRTVVAVFEKAESMGTLRTGWTPQMAANACICAFTGTFTEWLRCGASFDIAAMARMTFGALFEGFRQAAGHAAPRLARAG